MRIIVGISGASGAALGYRTLMALRAQENMEIHLVITEAAKNNFALETKIPVDEVEKLADYLWANDDLAAKISSGSFVTDGMIVVPCSMKTLSNIVVGNAGSLLVRAADVCMKEGRKVVLVPREMPLSKLHLRNLAAAADIGCTIVPPMLTFYNHAETLDKQMDHVVGKILMQFGLSDRLFVPWNGGASD